MKETISVTSIFQIVVLFILLFAGIMALTINNSTSFGVKDEIVTNIDLNEGFIFDADANLDEDIVHAMEVNSYRNVGRCNEKGKDEHWTGFARDGKKVVSSSDKASVCIRCVNVDAGLYKGNSHVAHDDFLVGYYFEVKAFYQLDLPSLNESFSFNTKGESRIFYTYPGKQPTICNW